MRRLTGMLMAQPFLEACKPETEFRPPPNPDKGTAVRYEIFGAGALFPCVCLAGQTRLVALTPCVPLSREAGEGEGAPPCAPTPLLIRVQPSGTESLKQTRFFALTPCVPLARRASEGEHAAPLSHLVGEGLGVRAKKCALPTRLVWFRPYGDKSLR
jgi:hypothetical protein